MKLGKKIREKKDLRFGKRQRGRRKCEKYGPGQFVQGRWGGIGILSYFPRIQATFLSTERNFYMTPRAKSGLIGQVGTCTYICNQKETKKTKKKPGPEKEFSY